MSWYLWLLLGVFVGFPLGVLCFGLLLASEKGNDV
jgi:hypothetical protein